MADENVKFSHVLRSFLEGNISMPWGVTPRFIYFIIALAILYITNVHQAEKNVRQIAELKADIKELRYVQITEQSELMNMSKQSEVLKRLNLENVDLKELTEPPRIVQQ